MDYPHQFSREARNRVEAENVGLCRRALNEARTTILPVANSPLTRRTSDEFNREFFEAILRVFLAFAEEAMNLSQVGTWNLAIVDREAREFLRQLTINFRYEEGRDKAGNRVRDVVESNWGGSLAEWVWIEFKKRPAWTKYEDLVLIGISGD